MRLFYIFLIFILNIYIVNAEINIFKETYSPKETFQAEISFQNLVEEIKSSNVVILNSDNQPTNIGVLFAKVANEKYFVYFDVPEIEEGDYLLAVKNVKYLEDEILKKADFNKKFAVKKEANNLISIKPSFIIFNKEDKNFFKTEIKNNGENILNIKISEESNSTNLFNNNLTIAKGSEDSFYLSLIEDSIKERDKLNIKLVYEEKIFFIPVYLKKEQIKGKLLIYKNLENKDYLDKYYVEMPFGNYAEASLFLENNQDKNLSNLTLSLSENLKDLIKLGFYNIDLLENKKNLQLNLFINSDRKFEKNVYSGDLIIKSNEIETIFPISINIVESQIYNVTETQEIDNSFDNTEIIPIIESERNQTTPIKKLDKKNLAYMLISAVILFFFLVYVIIFIRTGKRRN
jgi:hypothetical protein